MSTATTTTWLLTYLAHSTILLGVAWLIARFLGDRRLALQEILLRIALVGGLLTSTLQVGLGVEPVGGSLAIADLSPAEVITTSGSTTASIASGETTFDEMVSDIKEGLIVDQLMGASQGNVLGGDFSGNVLLGFKIENGEIAGRIKDTMVSGNIYQLLKDITAIGSEARWVGSFLNTPPIYLSGVSVASK